MKTDWKIGRQEAVLPEVRSANRPRLMKSALALALGAALLLGVPQAGLAQRGGGDRDHRPPNAPHEPQKNQPRKPAPDRPGQGGKHDNFNKWDKGPEAHRPQPNRGKGGGDFHRFDPGLDHSRARNMARAEKMHGYKPLPDSVRRSIHVGRPLPPKARPVVVPEHMRKRLPHHPGYEWRITGRDLILVAVGSLIVYEIFENVFD